MNRRAAILVIFSANIWAGRPLKAFFQSSGYEFAKEPQFSPKLYDLPRTFIVDLTLRPDGSVTTASVRIGEATLAPLIEASARQWRFQTTHPLPAKLQVWVYFNEDDGTKYGPPPPYPEIVGQPISAIRFRGVSDKQRAEILRHAKVKVGDIVSKQMIKRLDDMAYQLDPPVIFRIGMCGDLKVCITYGR